MHKHYRALWSASSIARYLVDTAIPPQQFSKFSDYLPPESVRKLLVKKRLHGIECEAVGLLSAVGQASLLRLPNSLWQDKPANATGEN
jgi:hypothetical protein